MVRGGKNHRKKSKKVQIITDVEAELNFIIPKTIPLILYPRKFFVSYPLSLELFVRLYLIPKPLRGPLI